MKANEAPEKLYFGESDKGILDIYSNRESNDEIEYTRTDAFIDRQDTIERWLKGRLADLYEESQCEVPELPKEVIEGKMLALRETLSFINTLEVKEVDFEKKKKEWIEQLCKYFKANYLYVRGHESFISDFRRYAKDLK